MTIRSLRPVAIASLLIVAAASVAVAHDLFLKPDVFFVAPNGTVPITVLNGTFSTSEGSVTRDRLIDIAIAGPAGRSKGDPASWADTGKASHWKAKVGAAGTYTLGASLEPRIIALEAKAFNEYLASDGLPDILAARKASGELAKPSRERYSKHVKALVQVGDAHTPSFGTVLGYPAEIVPLSNPYATGKGTLQVKALVDGKPIAGQVIIAGGRTPTGARLKERTVRTDASGVASIALNARGTWYVKFIRMVRIPASAKDSVDYESKWATMTFAIR
ncbi:MAG: DUF4198 domain-containing protein [Gemmatimonadaceae bacterium]